MKAAASVIVLTPDSLEEITPTPCLVLVWKVCRVMLHRIIYEVLSAHSCDTHEWCDICLFSEMRVMFSYELPIFGPVLDASLMIWLLFINW